MNTVRPKPHHCGRSRKLVTTEEARTYLRGKHCQVTAWTDQKIKPARGQMRIGLLKAHRANPEVIIACGAAAAKPPTGGGGVRSGGPDFQSGRVLTPQDLRHEWNSCPPVSSDVY